MNVVSHDTTRRPASCRRCETGVDLIGAIGALAAGGPMFAGPYVLTDIAGEAIGQILSAAPEADDRPMPFYRLDVPIGHITPRTDIRRLTPDGRIPPLDSEWIEAEERVIALADLARSCGIASPKVDAVVRAIRARMWAGLSAHEDDAAIWYSMDIGARPTRGQVRAWLGAFATELGKRCGDQHLSALSDAVAAPLTTRVAPRATSSLVLWAVGAVAAGVALLAVMR